MSDYILVLSFGTGSFSGQVLALRWLIAQKRLSMMFCLASLKSESSKGVEPSYLKSFLSSFVTY